jgi:predicted RNase H-like nuclease (RuvC/YqgF family)
MGKTESIKERRVDVYLDTLGRKERWTELAEEADESLSKFVQQCVEYAIEQGGPDFTELSEQSKKIQTLEDELTDLQKDIKQKEIVIDKLESELKRHRTKPFTQEEFEGVRQYDQDLIDILQSAERITGDEILRRLDIDPTETELVQGIDQQLQHLESFGLVTNTPKGWRWTL